jgi:hypothetical protein
MFINAYLSRKLMVRCFKKSLYQKIRACAKSGTNAIQVNFSTLSKEDEDMLLELLKKEGFKCKELAYNIYEISW